METNIIQITHSGEKAAVNTLMADIGHFCFYSTMADLDGVEGRPAFGRLRSSLQAMNKLACQFFRSQYPTAARPNEISGNSIMWPHLTYLAIKGIEFLDFRCLAALLYRYKDSLRHDSLYDVVYYDEGWSSLRRVWVDLRAAALDKIQIWVTERMRTHQLDWRMGKQRVSPMELRREAHRRVDTGPCNEIMFRGGAWSPSLGSALNERLMAPLFSTFAHTQPLAETDAGGAENEIRIVNVEDVSNIEVYALMLWARIAIESRLFQALTRPSLVSAL